MVADEVLTLYEMNAGIPCSNCVRRIRAGCSPIATSGRNNQGIAGTVSFIIRILARRIKRRSFRRIPEFPACPTLIAASAKVLKLRLALPSVTSKSVKIFELCLHIVSVMFSVSAPLKQINSCTANGSKPVISISAYVNAGQWSSAVMPIPQTHGSHLVVHTQQDSSVVSPNQMQIHLLTSSSGQLLDISPLPKAEAPY